MMGYFVTKKEGIEDVLSMQLHPKDGKEHLVTFAYHIGGYTVPDNAFSYLHAQGKEIVDYRCSPLWAVGEILMMVSYK